MVHIGELWAEFSVKLYLFIFQKRASCRSTSDSKHFILENFDIILNSPYQIYNSALVLCPSSSWLHEYYEIGLPQKIRMVVGPAEWGTCICSASCSSSILACRNNTIAVYGSADGKLTLLDATTGCQSATLSGHINNVNAVSFSFNGTLLVSGGSDRTIKLWDIQTGGIIKEANACMPGGSVSVSADNSIIASSTTNGPIYL